MYIKSIMDLCFRAQVKATNRENQGYLRDLNGNKSYTSYLVYKSRLNIKA